ncbi:MAG: branched-chain amino acid ABC transporter substrate-binding protein, partial [Desulfobacterales bacterium]|nr:branched-chain amino acid ABC transporter substrate-binding protein [Desulfobacterales bacterium]
KILNRSVEIQVEDTGCTAEGGANAALKIIADPKHVAIFGTTCSGAAATSAEVMSDAGLTMISGNNSAPFLTSIAGNKAPNWQEGYFRTAMNEEKSGKAAATFAYEKLGIRKAATINDGDIYTRGLTDGFNKSFTELGGQVVLKTSINKGDVQMKPVLTAVANSEAELIFFPLFQPEGNHILLQARSMDSLDNVVLMSDGALIDESFLSAVGDKGVGMYFVGPASYKGEKVEELEKKYQAKYQHAPSVFYFISGYDAALILFEAIEKAAQKETDGTVYIGRSTLRKTMYATKNFQGATGSLTCDEFGDCARPVFNILRFQDESKGLEGLKSNVQFTFSPSE